MTTPQPYEKQPNPVPMDEVLRRMLNTPPKPKEEQKKVSAI